MTGEVSSVQSPSTSGGQVSPVSGGGADVTDIQKAFKSTQGELQSTKTQMARISQEFEGHKQKSAKDSELLSGMRELFNPAPKEVDPVAGWERQLDYYLEQAVEAERNGNPIPLTTNLATQHFQAQIKNYQERQELMKVIQDLQNKMTTVSDPQLTINHQAYSNIDNQLIRGIDQLYGNTEASMPTRQAQFDAISKQIATEIKGLMAKAPQQWDKIRRSPEIQKNLVNHFLKQNLPPQAVKLIEQENLQKTPMTTQALWEAFREAASIEDEGQRSSIRAEIRQEILDRMAQSKTRRRN